MQNITFLSDQNHPSGLPEVSAPRRALLYSYHLAARKKIVSVCAPAGYGKTVSTLLWLRDSEVKSVWISLDSYCNTPAKVYMLLCAGLAQLQPDNRELQAAVSNPYFATAPVEYAAAAIAALHPNGEGYALVLEDYHLITDICVSNSLPDVLSQLPDSFTVFVLSRTPLPESWQPLKSNDALAVISVAELAFTGEEIRKFFAANNRILSPGEAEHIHTLTSGWAIGVTALVKSGEPLSERLAENVLGDYIEARIWSKWDKRLKEFLLKVSIVDILTVPLCKRLTGHEDGGEMLERLCAANMFLQKLSDDTYRIHQLFLDFLRLSLTASGLDQAPLHAIAARYYIEQGEYFTAARYALRGGDAELIAEVVQGATQPIMLPVEELLSYFKFFRDDEIPAGICESLPYVYGEQMGYYYYSGRADMVEYCFDKIYESLPRLFAEFPQFIERTVFAMHLDYRIPLAEQMRRLQNMPDIPITHEITPLFSFTMAYMPFFHRGARDYSELADENLMREVAAVFGALLRENAPVAVSAARSGLLLEQNRLNEALQQATIAKGLIGRTTGADVAFCIDIHTAEIYAAMGETEKYSAKIAEIENFIAQNNAMLFLPNFKAYVARHRLRRGDLAQANEWLSHYFVTEMKKPQFHKMYRYFTTIRAYMVRGEMDIALEYAMKLKVFSEDYQRPADTAEALTLMTIIYWRSGHRDRALNAMGGALRILQKYGFVRIIADEGDAILPALKTYKRNSEKITYQGEWNPIYVHRVYMAAHEQAKRLSDTMPLPVKAKLSKQQLSVIKLLSQGYANADIVKATGLTLHTIRTHTSSAYKKLGADNSADAVLTAKVSGLLD